MKKILSMILLLCAAFSVQLRAEDFTAGNRVYIQGKAANADWGLTSALVLKTDDIHPPKTGISVHFSCSLS